MEALDDPMPSVKLSGLDHHDSVPHRAVLAPRPEHSYPAPWRLAEERNGHVIVVCAEGHYVAECPTATAAEVIVTAVNAYAAGIGES